MAVERLSIESRDAWLALRRQSVNASEVAIVCGEGAYGSLAELYAEKKGLRPPLVDSGVLRRGRWNEAAVFEALADERPEWQIVRAKVYLRDRELRLGCTPDGFALAPDRDGRGVIQAKTVSRSVFRRRWLDDPDSPIGTGEASPPSYYVLQVITEMMLSGCSWGVLAVLIMSEFDSTLRLFDIERNPEAEGRIEGRVADFWCRWFDPGIMPPFDPQRDELLIKSLYPQDDGTEIDLTRDNRAAQVADDLVETMKARKRLAETEDRLKAELQAKLGEHTFARLAGGTRLSWKTQHRRAYSVAANSYRVLKIMQPASERIDND
ncbi:MAG TPA: YqaJ viral recombinase family protein [Xanthobacteraceae bacterium]|jgi:predicted phage-related endonuclease